jgi:transcription elongation factor Elf1
MTLLRKIWPAKTIQGKNLGKKYRKIKIRDLKRLDVLQTKYLCPVCRQGTIQFRDCGSKGTCIICGQSYLIGN